MQDSQYGPIPPFAYKMPKRSGNASYIGIHRKSNLVAVLQKVDEERSLNKDIDNFFETFNDDKMMAKFTKN